MLGGDGRSLHNQALTNVSASHQFKDSFWWPVPHGPRRPGREVFPTPSFFPCSKCASPQQLFLWRVQVVSALHTRVLCPLLLTLVLFLTLTPPLSPHVASMDSFLWKGPQDAPPALAPQHSGTFSSHFGLFPARFGPGPV